MKAKVYIPTVYEYCFAKLCYALLNFGAVILVLEQREWRAMVDRSSNLRSLYPIMSENLRIYGRTDLSVHFGLYIDGANDLRLRTPITTTVHSCVIDLAAYGLMDVRIYHAKKDSLSLSLLSYCFGPSTTRGRATLREVHRRPDDGRQIILLTSRSARRSRFLEERGKRKRERRRGIKGAEKEDWKRLRKSFAIM